MNKILAVTKSTFYESLRSKVLYAMLVFATLLVLAALLFGSVSVGDKVIVVKNFGLFCISLFGVSYAVIAGSLLLSKELERKTIYNILSKPVHRWEFIIGKYLGLLSISILMTAVLGISLTVFSTLLGGENNLLILEACLFITIEIAIVCAATIFFSSIVVTPMLSGLFAFGVFLTGRSSDYLSLIEQGADSPPLLVFVTQILKTIIPKLNHLAVSDLSAYGISVPFEHLIASFVYGAGWSATLLCVSIMIFRRKNFL